MGQTILEQLEGLPKHKVNAKHFSYAAENKNNGNAFNASHLTKNPMELFSNLSMLRLVMFASFQMSVGNDGISLRGSDFSATGISNGSTDLPGDTVVSRTTDIGHAETQSAGDAPVVLPLDQRHKLDRILLTMQRRLVTAAL
ncbi:hypothetical protein K1719_044244 [Acacia pycnantha]|nr:hypothetical protein K1719_044244 [Acacia pycnantha]